MPRIKGKIETITIQDQEEITPNKTIPLGETRIKEIKTPKGETITINHDKRRTITSELTSLTLYVVIMDIILTISPKLSISNG
jgi:hypothetical protein